MAETELLAGAIKNLRNVIHPLIHSQPYWTGTQALQGDSLYQRMRQALTAATSKSGAPMQASKPPARVDVMAWFCDIDSVVAEWPGPAATTIPKLDHYHDRAWCPDELKFVKAVARACERWTDTAKQLLGDNPPSVPLRTPCPRCEALWAYGDDTRQYAIRATATMDSWHVQCAACKSSWITESERAMLLKMLYG